jgi:hypothetical protein
MRAAEPFPGRKLVLKVCARSVLRAVVLLLAVQASAATPTINVAQPQPIRIAMEPLGFEPLQAEYLLDGATGLTVDFVDNDHLLVSFNTRSLMKREPDEQASDDDRTVEALLVELPSGKVLARTDWRLHDRLQYLWNLGHGRFLLRVRDRLSLLAPLDRLADGDAFRGTSVLDLSSNGVDRRIVALEISSDQDLLTLETVPRHGATDNVTFSGNGEDAGVQINFYRLNVVPEGFMAEPAGVVRAPAAVSVPMTRAGILDVLSGGKDRWLFNFNENSGKVDELAEWDATCGPRAIFVSHSEFVAFACRGSQDAPEIAGFNLKGEQMWEQGLYEPFVAPGFAFAPAAGRFVLERTVLTTSIEAESTLPPSAVAGEEARVYQTETGKVLLKVNVSPVERTGANYALSPDGMRLAAFDQTITQRRTSLLGDPYTETATTLVVYPLPPLGDKERAQIKEMEARAPADTGARIDAAFVRLGRENTGGETGTASPKPSPQEAVRASAPANPAAGNAPGAGQSDAEASAGEPGNPAMNGELPNAPGMGAPGPAAADEEPSGPRQAPTLYEPGEQPARPNNQ